MAQPILVMGAGLTGCSVALELALRGFEVVLIDRNPLPMLGASLRNEGKIHLGFVYAADPSFATAELQLRGALTFSPLLERWAGPDAPPRASISNPFVYLVDELSLHSPSQLEHHYNNVECRYHQLLSQFPGLNYMGVTPDKLWGTLPDEISSLWFSGETRAAYNTREVAVDTVELAETVRKAVLSNNRITFTGDTDIVAVKRDGQGFKLDLKSGCSETSIKCGTLVNCTWESRLFFDQMLGIEHPRDLLHRLKFRVIATCQKNMLSAPSVTRVLGRFGDVVIRPNGTAFLSWYPAGLRGWSASILPPAEWLAPMQGKPDAKLARDIAKETKSGIANWYPAIAEFETIQVDAGAIVAWGEQDVDEQDSGLHRRDRIGSWHHDGYWTVEPGKLTTAPLAGFECAERIARVIHGKGYDETAFSDSLLDRIQRGKLY